MSKSYDLGRKGEELAVAHLKKSGYKILHTNWRFHHFEIDIIAREGDELVIVEVKSRGRTSCEHPLEAMSKRKISFLVQAADAYITEHDIDMETRFDVVSIIFFSANDFKLEHYKNAFYPTL